MASPPLVFNRALRRKRRERAARSFPEHDFLHRRVIADIVDRLETAARDFPRAAFLGAGDLTNELTEKCGVGWAASFDEAVGRLPGSGPRAAMDEEWLALAPTSLDLIVSVLSLHAVNDLIGALAQARAALKPDGLFIGALFGGDTLSELRAALYGAEIDVEGGAAPRVAPFAHVKDLGGALQRAGFALPVADVDEISVTYGDPMRLFADLRGLGETHAPYDRPPPLRRETVAKMASVLSERGGTVRFDVITLTGWAPAPSQQKPLRPGSAKASLAGAVLKDFGTGPRGSDR
ncbi:MAG: methyltransferase domain-containing protein [Pseudomonadota bacterium]